MWIRLRRRLNEVYNCFKPLKDGFIGHKWLCTSPCVAECVPALPTASRLTVEQAVRLWTGHFQQRGVSEPHLSSQYIIAHLLGAKTLEGIGQDRLAEFLTQEQTEQTWELCTRRLTRMPVQYVIEEWDFRDLTLKMRPPVFIPRPETEELVGLVLTDLQMKQGTGLSEETSFRCLEVGCGSGAISLSLLKSLPQLRAIALDKNKDAVDLTRENSHSRVYLEVDPRHPHLIQQWVEESVEGLHYLHTHRDITDRPRFCILQKKKCNTDRTSIENV
ncbi:MTRF1L release factor glutamine methyltransferase isoform X2 [Salmo salar]|uniref:MTRF1L release factor glutamine methyltransferase isoform X2 n=1 Tax=Salmo salar TaxID=8030 RepID=A0ABM3CMN1_SALSA|nr:MTRF1L release factor glutamine methyltransferase isoform X2 [Salmo salar]